MSLKQNDMVINWLILLRSSTKTYHIKIASSRGPPLKITVLIKGIIKIINNERNYKNILSKRRQVRVKTTLKTTRTK